MIDVKLKILNKIVSDGNDFFCFGGMENQYDREKFLFRKLKEEVDELSSLFYGGGAGNIPQKDVVNEAGDLFFVIASICDLYGLEWFEVAAEGIEKFGKRFKETIKKMNIEASFVEAWKQVKREEAEND